MRTAAASRTFEPDSIERVGPPAEAVAWLLVLRRYVAFLAGANLIWEVAQLPLYTIWSRESVGEIAFAALHCTLGDVLIAGASLLGALLLFGAPRWPFERYRAVAALTLAFGLGYTLFSEWLNIVVREAWVYSELMPVIPLLGVGLSPVVQWIVIPLAACWWARRAVPAQAD